MGHEPVNLGDLIPSDRLPTDLAFIDTATGRSLAWAEYRAMIDAMARGFLARGLRRGDRVGLLGLNSFNYVCAYLGAMRAGLVTVPINHRLPKAGVEFIAADASLRLMLIGDGFLSLSPEGVETVSLDRADIALADRGSFEPVPVEADEIATILYTSGSTGRPKGVPLDHRGQIWVLQQRTAIVKFGEHRLLVAAPLCHMNALLMVSLAALGGASIVLLPEFKAEAYIAAIDTWHPTWLTSVPTMLALVAQRTEQLAQSGLGSVRIVAMGSAPVSEGLFATLRNLFPQASVVTNYGTTEAGAGVFGNHPAGLPRPSLSVGYPFPNIGFRLIGADGQEDAAQGRLQLRTPAVMSGYLNMPEKTAEVLDADGWYDTGDIFRRDENGFCFFVSRADDMFVCGGENIFPIEVEALLERHPAVQQACVVPVPDEIKGMKPVAFVVPATHAEPDPEALKAYAIREAPAYMHPRRIWFLDSLPLGPTGKVDRKALQTRAAADAGARL